MPSCAACKTSSLRPAKRETPTRHGGCTIVVVEARAVNLVALAVGPPPNEISLLEVLVLLHVSLKTAQPQYYQQYVNFVLYSIRLLSSIT